MSLRGSRSTGDAPLLAAAAVLEACRTPLGTTTAHTVAERLLALSSPQDVDRMLETIRLDLTVSRLRLAELARWLCRFGVREWQVKGGLALLGVSGTPGDLGLVTRLGLLDALTLYAVVAVQNLVPAAEAEDAVFELAKQVDGWGRIHCVYRLQHTRRADVARWLLRGGYDSGVAVEELALIAVTAGGLVDALQSETDEELLDHAGVLLAALTDGIQGQTLRDWPAGGVALELYLTRLTTAAVSLERLAALRDISRYLHGRADRNPHVTAEDRARLTDLADRALARPEWRPAVEAGLESDDRWTFQRALANAPSVGLDAKAAALRRLPDDPFDAYLWQVLRDGADREAMDELLLLAERLLDFSTLPTGASLHLGFGPGLEANRCFEGLVADLARFPGLGWPALRLGLANRVVRARSLSARTLESWPRDTWPEGAADAVLAAFLVEPDTDLRRRLGFLAGV